ncbi:hypothetical protein FQN54_003781 [Arachnomyces sp. PD_36]|nr:hypothetical protein FQN54_003781 [Arachnomyces sp. PD_36]
MAKNEIVICDVCGGTCIVNDCFLDHVNVCDVCGTLYDPALHQTCPNCGNARRMVSEPRPAHPMRASNSPASNASGRCGQRIEPEPRPRRLTRFELPEWWFGLRDEENNGNSAETASTRNGTGDKCEGERESSDSQVDSMTTEDQGETETETMSDESEKNGSMDTENADGEIEGADTALVLRARPSRVQRWNQAAVQANGFDPREIQGEDLEDLVD